MKIPVYDRERIASGESQVFSLPGEKRGALTIPGTKIEAELSRQEYSNTLFDIGTKIEAARDAEALAEAKVQTYEKFTALHEEFKDPGFIKGTKPEDYKAYYEKRSKEIENDIYAQFKGRPKTRDALGLHLNEVTRSEAVKTNALSRARVIEDLTYSYVTGLDEGIERASVEYNKGNIAGAARIIRDLQTNIHGAVASQLISANQGKVDMRTLQLKYNEAIQLSDINTAYNKGLKYKTSKYLDELIEGRYSKPTTEDTMTEPMRIKYKIMAERFQRGLKNELASTNYLAKEQLQNLMDDQRSDTRKFGGGDPKRNDKIDAKIAEIWPDDPDKAAAIKYVHENNLLGDRAAYSGTSTGRETPLGQEPQNPGLRPELRETYEKAFTAEQARKAVAFGEQGDPAGYVSETKVMKKAAKNLGAIMNNPAINEEGKAGAHREYVEKLVAEEKRQGVPVDNIRAIPKSNAKNTAAKLNMGDSQQKMNALDLLEMTYGSNYDKAYNDLVREGLNKNLKLAAAMVNVETAGEMGGKAGADMAQQIRRDLIDAADIDENKFQDKFDYTKKDATTRINRDLARYPNITRFENTVMRQGATKENVNTTGGMREVTSELAMLYMYRDNSTPSEAAEKAAKNVYDTLYNYIGGYRVPKRYNASFVDLRATNLVKELKAEDLNARYGERDAIIRDKNDVLYWANNRMSDGIELRMNHGGLAAPVYDASGNMIQIKFEVEKGELAQIEAKLENATKADIRKAAGLARGMNMGPMPEDLFEDVVVPGTMSKRELERLKETGEWPPKDFNKFVEDQEKRGEK